MNGGAMGAALAIFLVGTGAVSVLLRFGAIFEDGTHTAPERVPFTGGFAPTVHAWSRYHVRYYAMALLFIAFDMEMVFMYPWAVVFVREGGVALVEMLMFIAILLIGVLYAWREKALTWA